MTIFKVGLRRLVRPAKRGRAATVSIIFAFALVPLVLATAIAIDFSRIADARAELKHAVDNAALSGAAAITSNTQASYTRATVSATASFCDTSATMPATFVVSNIGGTGQQSCGGAAGAGPIVSTQIAGYKTGTPGIVSSSCSATNPVVAGVTCGFVVTVTAKATANTIIPAYLGLTDTVTATGVAANPFLNIGAAIQAQILGSAFNTNSIWIYPLLLDSNGNPDFSSNAGAIPGLVSGVYPADAGPSGCTSLTACGSIGTAASVNCTSDQTQCSTGAATGCTDSPTQFTCGNFTMLASTYYNTATNPCLPTAPCYPNGAGSYPEIIEGVIQNPQAPPTVITATTPIGIAMQSVAGGNASYGYGGYQTNPANGCYYPGNAVYTTVSQVFSNASNTVVGGSPAVDWPKVTHWFYSSYLASGYPPSEGEILSQSQLLSYMASGKPTVTYNSRIPSIGSDATGSFNPTLLNCSKAAGNGNSYDQFLTTTYPSSGATNASLFITVQAANSAYIPPASTGLAYQRYTPSGTPGYQYAALSCQAYGSNIYNFYWNDMGGSQSYGDDLDYGNGTVRVMCATAPAVLLIG
jgi:hypothetical protein